MKRFLVKRFLALILVAALSPAGAQAYDKPYVGDVIEYRTRDDDTFVHLARDYNLGFVEMRAANPNVDPWLPGSGKALILPARHILPDAPHKGLVINLPEMRMYAYMFGDKEPETYPIGIGREGLDTPIGATTVVRKVAGPVWTPTARMRKEKPELPAAMGPGPENPMGTHALYLGFPLIAIHGTNRAFGIGRRVSSGCIRLYPEDIIRVFNITPVGARVTVVNQPIKLAWIEGQLYLEAHPDVDQSIHLEETGEITPGKLSAEDMERIIRTAGPDKDRLNWPLIRKVLRERPGYPVAVARKAGSAAMEPEAVSAGQDKAAVVAAKQQIKTEAQEALVKIYGPENARMPAAGKAISVKADAATDIRQDRASTLNP